MKIENTVVKHIKFGEGQVQEVFGGKVKVQFEDGRSRIFQYPDAFEKYLRFETAEEQAEIMDVIAKKLEEREAEIKLNRDRMLQEEHQKKREKDILKKHRSKVEKKDLYIGETFLTHAAVLNKCFGFHYDHYQMGFKDVDDTYAVWFPGIAKQIKGEYIPKDSSQGWINILSEAGTLITETREDMQEDKFKRNFENPLDRLVFAKFDDVYKFIGVFRFEKNNDYRENGYLYRRIGTSFDLQAMKIMD